MKKTMYLLLAMMLMFSVFIFGCEKTVEEVEVEQEETTEEVLEVDTEVDEAETQK